MHDKQLIFVHPPKCAGTSIRVILRNHFGHPAWLPPDNNNVKKYGYATGKQEFEVHEHAGHYTMSEYIDWYTKKNGSFVRSDYYIVGVCRNPFDRMVSMYHHCKTHRGYKNSFEQFLMTNDLFDQLPRPTLFEYFAHQSSLLIDDIIHQETIQRDFDKVAQKLNIDNYILPREQHQTQRKDSDYRVMYNQKTIDRVMELCKQDIEYFGYKFGD